MHQSLPIVDAFKIFSIFTAIAFWKFAHLFSKIHPSSREKRLFVNIYQQCQLCKILLIYMFLMENLNPVLLYHLIVYPGGCPACIGCVRDGFGGAVPCVAVAKV